MHPCCVSPPCAEESNVARSRLLLRCRRCSVLHYCSIADIFTLPFIFLKLPGRRRAIAPEFIRAEQAANPSPLAKVSGALGFHCGVPHAVGLSWSAIRTWVQESNESMSRYAVLMGVFEMLQGIDVVTKARLSDDAESSSV